VFVVNAIDSSLPYPTLSCVQLTKGINLKVDGYLEGHVTRIFLFDFVVRVDRTFRFDSKSLIHEMAKLKCYK